MHPPPGGYPRERIVEVDQPAAFTLRLAVPTDIPALRLLIEQSVRGLQQNDYTPAQIDGALNHALGLDTQLIEDGTYFIAQTEDSTIAACGGWSPRATLFGPDNATAHGAHRMAELLDPATGAAKIRAIFVHPAFARQGLGSLLLAHCEQAARAVGFRLVEMGSTLTGVPLYTLRGYREIARLDVPLPNGESLPVVRMTKTLST